MHRLLPVRLGIVSLIYCLTIARGVAGEPAPVAGPVPVTPAPASKTPPTLANFHYGDDQRQVLDFWKATSDKPTPVVIYMHGGGWVKGDKKEWSKIRPEQLLKAGISVVSFNYRYSTQAQLAGVKPPLKWPMEDARRVVQFVRSKAAEWNIDRQRVATTGGSAGACTSLWLAFHDDMADPASTDPVARESTRLTCVAVDIPQTTLDPAEMKEWTPNSHYGGGAFGFMDPNDVKTRDQHFSEFLAHREELLPWIREYSPMGLATDDDPPVYMTYPTPPALGKDQKDPTHTANFGLKLEEKLKALGVECELVYPGSTGTKYHDTTDFLIAKLKK